MYRVRSEEVKTEEVRSKKNEEQTARPGSLLKHPTTLLPSLTFLVFTAGLADW